MRTRPRGGDAWREFFVGVQTKTGEVRGAAIAARRARFDLLSDLTFLTIVPGRPAENAQRSP
ncbi:hypothetical protein LJ656_10555 [Paraburkholderia sp. MMS20-SJTR3]|uniref:Uncharacterized protein n=1 Tax=Paraburkholderia sejongensis TaxID=2886946 RepID=A0ABS8JTG0_9BURK|nr:hypothetical protein [Paraburkholderia sp. MMS20-SJTR3]MCC8393030.1 hypothetical protein [Paraburkholderia sp. MMS20-SJTR3]